MTDRTRNATVGFTALAGITGLCVLLFLFGYVPAFFRQVYTIQIVMPDALTLNPGSQVTLYGINIGEVRAIDFRDGGDGGVVARVEVRDGVLIPAGVHAEIDTDLLGGTATVSLVPDDPDRPSAEALPTDGSAVIRGRLGSLAGAFSQLDRVATSIERVSAQWGSVGESINELLAPTTPAQVDAGATEPNLRSVVQRLDQRLVELEAVLADVRAYTANSELLDDVTTTAANVRKASDALETVRSNVGSLIDEARGWFSTAEEATQATAADARQMIQRYTTLANELTAASAALQESMDRVNQGEGTVAQLLSNPQLYESMEATVDRVGRLVDETTLLLEKWKAEGVPVQF